MKPIRTYEIRVDGYSDVKYSARSPAKARWRCYGDFGQVSCCSFGEFLAMSTIRRVDNPAGIGDRILVCGKPATRCLGSGNANYYMFDDSDEIMVAHDLEIRPMPAQVAA